MNTIKYSFGFFPPPPHVGGSKMSSQQSALDAQVEAGTTIVLKLIQLNCRDLLTT